MDEEKRMIIDDETGMCYYYEWRGEWLYLMCYKMPYFDDIENQTYRALKGWME
jgi:hypothetical protein